MQDIRIEKLTFNFGSGKDQAKLEKGMLLIKHITGKDPVKTTTQKRIPSWGLRPGLPVGCKLTLRKDIKPLIERLLKAKKMTLSKRCFDDNGTVSFGIAEYIDIPDVEYEPKIGIMGFEVSITLTRPGFRVKNRRLRRARIPRRHRISRDQAMEFMKAHFNINIGEKQ